MHASVKCKEASVAWAFPRRGFPSGRESRRVFLDLWSGAREDEADLGTAATCGWLPFAFTSVHRLGDHERSRPISDCDANGDNSMAPPEPSRPLSDHKRHRKRFVPPMLQLGEFRETSWVNDRLPEILWIGLLIQRLGMHRSAEVISLIADGAKVASGTTALPCAALASTFSTMSDVRQSTLAGKLLSAGALGAVQGALKPLIEVYPSCPIRHMLGTAPEGDARDFINEIRETVRLLVDRHGVLATQVQSHVVYAAFVQGILKTSPDVTLADFPEVEHFPDTERSREVAAAVRAACTMLIKRPQDRAHSPTWIREFWARGFEVDDCG